MINFFRHIRKSLLMENKNAKYLKYALGEIILVMIGILLALQVNNWNNNRINSKEEQKALNSIHSEFLRNRDHLDDIIKTTDSSIETGRQIMALINTDATKLHSQNVDSLIFQVFEYDVFNVSENSIQEILQSGKFQNLQNDILKSLILEWTHQKNRTYKTSDNLESKSQALVDYLIKNYPLKNIDAYGVLAWEEPSTINIDKHLVFYDIEFENIIDDFLYNLMGYNNRIKEIKKLVNNIIENTQPRDD